MVLRLGLIFSRKFIQQQRKHVFGDVALELFHGYEVLLAD